MKLGILEKVDLRYQWRKEDIDFTPWLAGDQNIQLLSEAVGIELEVQSQEENVGPFRADILCLDTINNHYVLIENQLERTDHTHLGQLMTYAAGLDAVTIIWIAQRFTEEHRAALDWLNSITDESINFFGIEIELYRIGDSLPAPMFKLVSKPNDWTKAIRKSASAQKLTDVKLQQQEYWTAFRKYLEETNESQFKIGKPAPQHWTNIAIGRSNFNLSATVNTRDNTIGVWLNIMGDHAKEHYDKLERIAKEESFSQISTDLDWNRLDDKKGCIVVLTRQADMTNEGDRHDQFQWMRETIKKFQLFFRPLIKQL